MLPVVDREFEGSVGTQVVKIFDMVVARTGLRQAETSGAGFPAAVTTPSIFNDHKAYYPGATEMQFRITGEPDHQENFSGRKLLGTGSQKLPSGSISSHPHYFTE